MTCFEFAWKWYTYCRTWNIFGKNLLQQQSKISSLQYVQQPKYPCMRNWKSSHCHWTCKECSTLNVFCAMICDIVMQFLDLAFTMKKGSTVISGFCHKLDDICAFLGSNAVYSGNSSPTFWDSLLVLSSKVKNWKMGPDKLFWNVCKELPPYTAYYPRTVHISTV